MFDTLNHYVVMYLLRYEKCGLFFFDLSENFKTL